MAAHGGKRPGAGRRRGAVSQAKLDIAAMAKGHAQAALDVLVTVAKDDDAPSAARVSASTAILDRAYGKPKQALIGGDEGDAPLKLVSRVERVIVRPSN